MQARCFSSFAETMWAIFFQVEAGAMPKSLPAVQCGKWTIGSHAQVLDVLLLAPFAETQDKASRRLHYRDWLGPCFADGFTALRV